MKYTAAPGGDGVGPPVWAKAASHSVRRPKNGTSIEASMDAYVEESVLWIIAILQQQHRARCS
jgi:hypothetical protein